MRARVFALVFALAFAVIGVAGCPPQSTDPAVVRGKQAYMGTCIVCHNINPAVDGALGPALKGASKELVSARLLRAEYPVGYTPKRATHLMPAQPQLASSVDDITAFLNAP